MSVFGQTAPLFSVGILSVRLPICPDGSVSYCNDTTAFSLILLKDFIACYGRLHNRRLLGGCHVRKPFGEIPHKDLLID